VGGPVPVPTRRTTVTACPYRWRAAAPTIGRMAPSARRLVPLLLSALLLVPFAAPVAAVDPVTPPPPADPVIPDDAWLHQAGFDLVTLTNMKRASQGLVALRVDPTLMQVARDRAQVMATTDVMSHTEPDGTMAWDRMTAAGLTWYAAGEIIAWNHYPLEYTVAEAIQAWWASPGHHDIMVSSGYNYVGFGAAVSADGKLYYAGVFAKLPDGTVPWAKFGSTSTRTVDRHHKRVTVRWSGADTRLQVLTAGLHFFQVQWRAAGGSWHAWTSTTATKKSITLVRGVHYEFRIRARDRAGNWNPWRVISVRP
jgi:uncharacterized protein YkwD